MKIMIKLGKGKKAGKNVAIGEMPARKVGDLSLSIGENANLRSGTVIYLGSKIGSHLATGHNVVIREENRIGDHFSIWSNSIIDYGCRIGNGVKVHCNCYVAQYTILEDGVFMAPGTIISNDMYPGSPDAMEHLEGPTIQKGAQIGCNVTILPGVVIGEHSLIGAGSVVTKDIPPYSVAYGNPARPVMKITDLVGKERKNRPYKFLFDKQP
jgi:acetyltransferase-like isoleucine patch superfamily enzyme